MLILLCPPFHFTLPFPTAHHITPHYTTPHHTLHETTDHMTSTQHDIIHHMTLPHTLPHITSHCNTYMYHTPHQITSNHTTYNYAPHHIQLYTTLHPTFPTCSSHFNSSSLITLLSLHIPPPPTLLPSHTSSH